MNNNQTARPAEPPASMEVFLAAVQLACVRHAKWKITCIDEDGRKFNDAIAEVGALYNQAALASRPTSEPVCKTCGDTRQIQMVRHGRGGVDEEVTPCPDCAAPFAHHHYQSQQ